VPYAPAASVNEDQRVENNAFLLDIKEISFFSSKWKIREIEQEKSTKFLFLASSEPILI